MKILRNIIKDNCRFLESISFTFLITSIYYLFSNINVYDLISFTLATYLFLLVTTFVLDGFTLSNDSIIRKLQKWLFYIIFVLAFILILYYLDLYSTIDSIDYTIDNNIESYNKDINNDHYINSNNEDKNNEHYEFKAPKKVVNDVVDTLAKVATNVIPNMGAAAAGGSMGSTALKLTNSLPPVQRAAAAAGSAFIGAAATASGIQAVNSVTGNNVVMKAIENSKYGNAFKNPERPPSPDENMIQSILENELNIPLLDLLDSLYTFNFLELILILLLAWIWINRYFYQFNLKYLSNFIDKHIGENSKFSFLRGFIKTGDNYNSKFTNILMIIMISLLIIIKIANLFFMGELINKIDDFITVYNYIKKS